MQINSNDEKCQHKNPIQRKYNSNTIQTLKLTWNQTNMNILWLHLIIMINKGRNDGNDDDNKQQQQNWETIEFNNFID